MKVLVSFLAFALCQVAHAEGVTMFGAIEIGKPLTMAQCRPDFQVAPHAPCWTKGRANALYVEIDNSPRYIGELPPVVYLKDGVVVGLDIYTTGVIGQADAMDALTGKFGKPAYVKSSKVKTVAGADHDSLSAKWQIGDVRVLFSGTLDSAANGVITIGTPQLDETRKPPAQTAL